MSDTHTLIPCPSCNTPAGQPHAPGCDIERCSVCGVQRLGCLGHHACDEAHYPAFARWIGLWPGEAEADHLNMSLTAFYGTGAFRVFFIKPTPAATSTSGAA